MPKSRMHIILLAIWLFAIAAPSAITFLSDDGKSYVTNLNEEEQQEQGEKTQLKEKFLNSDGVDFGLLEFYQKNILGEMHPQTPLNHSQEIFLPPPEHNC